MSLSNSTYVRDQLERYRDVDTWRYQARARVTRVRSNWRVIVQTALAAGTAWFLDQQLLGHPAPAFAPIAAVISLGAARRQPWRRAIELAAGVAVGIGVADLLVELLGRGALSIGLIVGLTMAMAMLLGAGTIFVNQSAVSAIFVVALQPPGSGFSPDRFFDACIGGAVALVVAQVLVPRQPLRHVVDASRPVIEEIGKVLDRVAGALEDGDPDSASDALLEARAIDDSLTNFYDAVAVARENAWLSPAQSRTRGQLREYANAARQVDYAVRNTRVLARAALNGLRKGRPLRQLGEPVRTLADAVRSLADSLADPDNAGTETRRLSLEAARAATALLDRMPGLGGPMVIGQIRATATDLLRGLGMDYTEAMAAIDEVAPVTR